MKPSPGRSRRNGGEDVGSGRWHGRRDGQEGGREATRYQRRQRIISMRDDYVAAWLHDALAYGTGLAMLTADEVTVDADAAEIPVGIDGETVMLPTPVRCTIQPRALRGGRAEGTPRRSRSQADPRMAAAAAARVLPCPARRRARACPARQGAKPASTVEGGGPSPSSA